jgi:hypothetical protein
VRSPKPAAAAGLGAIALALVAVLAACNNDSSLETSVPADAVADFALTDVNATSPSAGRAVSPRDYLGQVSAWYFGHST